MEVMEGRRPPPGQGGSAHPDPPPLQSPGPLAERLLSGGSGESATIFPPQAESCSPGPLNPIKPPVSPPGALSPPQQTFPEPLLYVQCYARYWEHTCPDLAPVLEVLQILGPHTVTVQDVMGQGKQAGSSQPGGSQGCFQEAAGTEMRGRKPDFKTRRG